jgi:phage repressor protein C with HTH and peptisase S24 domain
MEPVIPDGATVAVDTGNKRIIDGELYAINQGELKRIKQLYRKPGGKLLIAVLIVTMMMKRPKNQRWRL